MTDQPRILLFTGDGKGKTTAALGLALRAAGHDMHVCIIQFIKNDPATGEITALSRLPQVEIVQTGRGLVRGTDDPRWEEHCAAAEAGLLRAQQAVASGQYDLVVLDEICMAVAMGLIEEASVVRLVEEAPPEKCLVLTGRGATPRLIELADTATEMRSLRHAFDSGIPAQDGVER